MKTLILEKIVDYTFNIDSNYFIDNEEKLLFQNIIAKLKNVSNDENYITMLDDVLNDLNQFSNKTVSEIKAEIN
ncbi:hypothetical protein IMCC3317_05420 [Kordia antarctica]|uniref:Uncharacterized protein n=1 Tax=Kordia antarctica TaxID=1218801 RepID=A0A7L4ZG43_9FLAO|nr:hypothetical protein [Kordia antarctica]QHI35196.1 hypothetical protein IMCC3317_05420 [Kordia antarctica]